MDFYNITFEVVVVGYASEINRRNIQKDHYEFVIRPHDLDFVMEYLYGFLVYKKNNIVRYIDSVHDKIDLYIEPMCCEHNQSR